MSEKILDRMRSIVINNVERYQTDLSIDVETICMQGKKGNEYFWLIRDSGTHLFLLEPESLQDIKDTYGFFLNNKTKSMKCYKIKINKKTENDIFGSVDLLNDDEIKLLLNIRLEKDYKLIQENGKLVFQGETDIVLYEKEPLELTEEELDILERENRGTEWRRSSGKFINYVFIRNEDIIKLVDDWKKVGSSKYGRTVVSEKYKLRRGLTISEFYNS